MESKRYTYAVVTSDNTVIEVKDASMFLARKLGVSFYRLEGVQNPSPRSRIAFFPAGHAIRITRCD